MGLLDGITQNEYYQGRNYGNYQFISLQEIIAQFEIAYVGEGKLIPKLNKLDIQFHAMRALQELSFDTFKSFKSQQIDVPPSLQMILPHDYVNYTKISSVDSAGIKHLLYPVKETNNPFQIKQNTDGSYFFGTEGNQVTNSSFDTDLQDDWEVSMFNDVIDVQNTDGAVDVSNAKSGAWGSIRQIGNGSYYANFLYDTLQINNGDLEVKSHWMRGGDYRAYAVWQRLEVGLASEIELYANASSGAQQLDGATLLCDYGVVRVGITSTNPSVGFDDGSGNILPATNTAPTGGAITPNKNPDNFDLGYLEWSDGTTSQKELLQIDVDDYEEVWVYIQIFSPWTSASDTTATHTVTNPVSGAVSIGPLQGSSTAITPTASTNNTPQTNTVSSVEVIIPGQIKSLQSTNSDGNSSTWNNYKSHVPSEINANDYQDYANDKYWPNHGERYGLDPKHAQVNGSFYIDQVVGKIHFSSNISGKTVILDYISDSLGTDGEMQVHKLAEEAMYKHIACAVLSTSGNPMHQQLVPRFKKEKFAAVRQAKLRLSNIKLEEITQVLRGKSKQIKH